MSTFSVIALIVGIVLLVGLIWVTIYNRLMSKRNWVEETLKQIDVQLKRRNNLIPNLTSTVKEHIDNESNLLEAVTRINQQMTSLSVDASIDQVNQLSNKLSVALARLLTIVEHYPQLNTDSHFLNLYATLNTIEKDIAFARQLYNSAVTEYNKAIEIVPNNIIARISGFSCRPVLKGPTEQ